MSNTKLVNFAQKKAYLVDDDTFLKVIKDKLSNTYRLNLKTGNKYYKFLEEKDLPILKKFEHHICFNLKQRPTYLFLTTFQKQKFCLYFDVELKDIYSVKQRFDEDLFNDTLLEGELVKVSQQHYIYLISDLLVYNGKINNNTLDKKINILQKIVFTKHRTDPGFDPCQLLVKDFIEYKHLKSFMNEYYLTVPYRQYISGIIFRPVAKSNRNIIIVLNKNNFHKINLSNLPISNISDINNVNNINSRAVDSMNTAISMNVDENTNVGENANVGENTNVGENMNFNLDDNIHIVGDVGDHMNEDHMNVDGNMGAFSLQNLLQKFKNTENEKDDNHTNDDIIIDQELLNDNISSGKRKKVKIDHKKHTEVTFEIRKTDMPDVYQLWLLNDNNILFKYGIACIPTRNTSEIVKLWFSDNPEKVMVICNYMKNFSKWNPCRLSNKEQPDVINEIMKL